jgi:hypothetical protein
MIQPLSTHEYAALASVRHCESFIPGYNRNVTHDVVTLLVERNLLEHDPLHPAGQVYRITRMGRQALTFQDLLMQVEDLVLGSVLFADTSTPESAALLRQALEEHYHNAHFQIVVEVSRNRVVAAKLRRVS